MGRTKKEKPVTPIDLLKLEIAKELGLMEKVQNFGWKALTAKESGQIGGIMSKRLHQLKNNNACFDWGNHHGKQENL